MTQIGIFFGSDTGNTETIANMLQQQLETHQCTVQDIANSTQADIEQFQLLLLGIPTWYYGEAQCDWDDFFCTLAAVDFSDKRVAIFGCGDQEDYAEYFCDAMGTLREIVVARGATIIGHWPTGNYHFEASKALVDDTHFIGLVIDEDRQPELTTERVKAWSAQLCQEIAQMLTKTGTLQHGH